MTVAVTAAMLLGQLPSTLFAEFAPFAPEAAAGTLDQEQATIDASVGPLAIGSASEQKLAQVVTAGSAGLLSEIGLPVSCAAGATLRVDITRANANGPYGSSLSWQTYPGSSLPPFSTAPSFRSLALSSSVYLAAGSWFAIVLSASGATTSDSCSIAQGPSGDPYANGNGYYDARPNTPGVWVALGTRADLPFKTFMDPAPSRVVGGTDYYGPIVLQLNPASDPVGGACGFGFASGTGFKGTPSVVHHSVGLSSFANQTVRVRFQFNTGDGLYNRFEGWYLDNVKVTDPARGQIFFDDVEAANPGWTTTGNFGTTPGWHSTTRRGTQFGGHSWWYGNEATGTFEAAPDPFPSDTCGDQANFGSLISPTMTLGASSTLDFDTLWQIESINPSSFDLMQIAVEVVKTATTTTVQNASATFGDASVDLVATVSSADAVPDGTVTFTVKSGATTIGSPVSATLTPLATVDQQQTTFSANVGWAIGDPPAWQVAQSFTVGVSGLLTEVQMPVGCSSPSLKVEIQGVTAGKPNGTVLASRTFAPTEISSQPNPNAFVKLPFSTPLQVSAGTQLAIVLSAVPTNGSICSVNQGPSSTTYAGGDGYHKNTTTVPDWTALGQDLPFKTFVATNTAQAAVAFSMSGVNAGSYTIEGSYSGSATFAASSGTGALVVNKAATATSVGNASAAFGQPTVTLSASVVGSVVNEGSVTFTVTQGATTVGTAQGSVVDGTASAAFPLTGVGPGSYSIGASYSGGTNFKPSTAATAGTLTVAKAATTTTVTKATASFGQPTVNLQASVTANAPSTATVNEGTVVFTVKQGATTIGTATTGNVTGGIAAVDDLLPAGTSAASYTIEAAYSGSANFEASSGTGALTVNKANTTTTAQNATATFGDASVQLLATVASSSGTPDGSITFTITRANGTTVGTATATLGALGTATVAFPLASVNAGTYSILAAYGGSTNFNASSGTATLTVNKKPTTTETGDVTAFIGQTIDLTATVTGSQVNEGTVTFTINSSAPACGPPTECPVPIILFGTFTANVVNGQATVAVQLSSPPLSQPIPAGNYTINAAYQGLDHANSSDIATLIVKSGVAGTASCGGAVQPNATVRFYSGTTLVLTVIADVQGKFTALLDPATYSFTFEVGGVICGGGTVTITANGGSPVIANQIVDLKNHSWRTAYTLNPEPGFTPFCANARITTVSEHKFKADQSLWFRFLAGRGSVVQVTVKSKGTQVDVAFYRDIAKLASAPPPSSSSQLLLVGAEMADGDFADGDFADGDFADGDFADGDFADGDFADGDFADGDFADGDFADGDFADGDFADGDFAPDQLSLGEPLFGDENTSLLKRARIGVSARPGTNVERLTKIFWGDDQYIYVKIFGDGVSLTDQVEISVVACPGACTGTGEPTAAEGGWTVLHGSPTVQNKTVVVTDLAEQLQVADLNAALAHPDVQKFLAAVKAFLGLPENAPSIHVDVGTAPRVAFAKAQAKQHFACAWAQNLWMREIKKAVDAHRNPSLMFAVLVGDGGVIPFEQLIDRAGLGSSSRYLPRPPYAGNVPDRGALQNNMYLSQDRYGSKVDLNIGDFNIPIVDLAVGRVLGERARFAGDTDGLNVARGLFEAYPGATRGVVPTQGRRAGVASYGRQDDGAQEVARLLGLSIGAANVDTLRHPGGPNEGFNFVTNTACAIGGPDCVAPWAVDRFRSFIGAPRWLNVVGVHGRDSSALMADYRSRFFASEIAASATDLTNTLNLWLACNVGRSVGNAYTIEGLTIGPDFAEAYARKGAVLIGPTSYTYFETELASEYQERFNIEFAKQLTRGLSYWGKAFVAAKREYLIKTFQMSGLHEKQVLELVYYGLPHLMSDVPAQAGPSPASIVGPGDLTSSGGLQTAQELVQFGLTEQTPVLFRDAETGVAMPPAARYWAGRDGFVTDRTMPVLPLQLENTSHPQGVPLRGVALRSANFAIEDGVRIKTSAALFELMTAHSTFQSDVLYPIVPWRVNYFDALARPEGGTFVLFTPLQYATRSADRQTGRVNRFTDMTVNLYYSGDLSGSALLAAPAILDVSSRETNAADHTVEFRVRINSAAPVQQAWLTWFDVTGTTMRPIDLAFDPASGLWKASYTFGSAAQLANVRYGAWVVNAHGLVGRDLNNGQYYVPNAPEATATDPKTSTVASIVSTTPGRGGYRGEVTVVGKLATGDGTPIAGARLNLAIGPARGSALTGADGRATATLKLLMTPASYFASVSFGETGTHLGSSAETAYTVDKLGTQLVIETGTVCGGGYSALLKETGLGDALDQEAVVLEVVGTNGTYRTVELTRHDGRAFLSNIPLLPGTYTVRAYFAGTIPIGGGQTLVVDHLRYLPSVSEPATLTLAPTTVTIAYTGGTVAALGSALTFSIAVQTPVDASLLRDALVRYTVRDNGTVIRVRDAAKGTAADWAAIISDLPVGVYSVRAQMLGECTQSPETDETFIAIYDPSAGFVTGGGWINSPAGAYAPAPTLTGRANFGFVSKYLPGAQVPSGSTEFQFKVASLNFKSQTYKWLVVAGAKAQFKGSGTINGAGSYDFMLTAIDGQVSGGGGVDKFRIKIWDRVSGGLVYDNQVGAGDDAEPSTAIAGGSIVIHKK